MRGRLLRAGAAIGLVAVTAIVAATLASSPAAAAASTFSAIADTYVQATTPTTNYGTSAQYVVDNSPVRRTFLKFTVSGITSPITDAKLRRHGSGSGATAVAPESHVQHDPVGDRNHGNNQPAIDGTTMGTLLGHQEHLVRDQRDCSRHRQRHLQLRRHVNQQ
jgi:hypothetical protein